MSGLSGSELRVLAQDDTFQIGVLDFLLNHEPDLLAFIDACDLAPQAPAAAWHTLQQASPSRQAE